MNDGNIITPNPKILYIKHFTREGIKKENENNQKICVNSWQV